MNLPFWQIIKHQRLRKERAEKKYIDNEKSYETSQLGYSSQSKSADDKQVEYSTLQIGRQPLCFITQVHCQRQDKSNSSRRRCAMKSTFIKVKQECSNYLIVLNQKEQLIQQQQDVVLSFSYKILLTLTRRVEKMPTFMKEKINK